jgi:ATP/maltotriose-dependent transcriptional regulator MalT
MAAGEHELALRDVRAAGRLVRKLGTRDRALVQLAMGLALATREAGRSARVIRSALRRLRGTRVELARLGEAGFALMWLDESVAARAVLEAAVDHARRTRDPWFANLLDTLALLDYRMGMWSLAEARSAEALRVASDLGQTLQAGSCHTTLAHIAAMRGREADCRSHLAAAEQLTGRRSAVSAYAATALAVLELGAGRPDAAARSLAGIGTGDLLMLFDWRADLIESHLLCGREAEAVAELGVLEQHAEATRRRSARALAARCRGLLAPATRFDAEFAAALRLHETLTLPFEDARTRLCYGERLRRARRRADARPLLRSALESFQHLGATPWAERARRELAATYRHGERQKDEPEPLSPRERHIAGLVQRGSRTREVAQALNVAERTVEYHLTNIYRKLGVRSRTELAHRLWRMASAG